MIGFSRETAKNHPPDSTKGFNHPPLGPRRRWGTQGDYYTVWSRYADCQVYMPDGTAIDEGDACHKKVTQIFNNTQYFNIQQMGNHKVKQSKMCLTGKFTISNTLVFIVRVAWRAGDTSCLGSAEALSWLQASGT